MRLPCVVGFAFNTLVRQNVEVYLRCFPTIITQNPNLAIYTKQTNSEFRMTHTVPAKHTEKDVK